MMKTLYESILDADLDDMTDKMVDAEAYKGMEAFMNTHMWRWNSPDSRFDKVKYTFGKDKDGYYVDSEGVMRYQQHGDGDCKTFLEYHHWIDIFNSADSWKKERGDYQCPHFRWRKHKGQITIADNLQHVESIEGLPKDIDTLFMGEMCGSMKGRIDLGDHRIKKLRIHNLGKMTFTGHAKIDELEWTRSYNSKRPTIMGPSVKDMHEEKPYQFK